MKLVFGLFLIALSFYFYLGHPEKDLWPLYLGSPIATAWQALVNFRPYTIFLFFVFGVTSLLLIKKY